MKRSYCFLSVFGLLCGFAIWLYSNARPTSDTNDKTDAIHPQPRVVKNKPTNLHEKPYLQSIPGPIFLTGKASRYSAKFVVQNNLLNNVTLTGKRSSSGCLQITFEPEVLAPFEYSTVSLSAELGTKSVSKKLSADIMDATTEKLVASCGVTVDAYSVFEVAASTPRVIALQENGSGEIAIALLHHRVCATPDTLPTVTVEDH